MEVSTPKSNYISRKSDYFTKITPEKPKPRISVFGTLDQQPGAGPGRITVDPKILDLGDSSNLLGSVMSNVARRMTMRNSRIDIIISSIPEEIREKSMRMLFDPDGGEYIYDSKMMWEVLEKSPVTQLLKISQKRHEEYKKKVIVHDQLISSKRLVGSE
jgi:hypothetical protein